MNIVVDGHGATVYNKGGTCGVGRGGEGEVNHLFDPGVQ